MKHTSKLVRFMPSFIILFSFVIGISLYHKLPLILASHWSASGAVNGYTSKFQGLFFLPFISTFIYLLFLLLPKLDPLKENIQKFRIYYDSFILVFIIFFFYIHILTILWNLGFQFNMSAALSPALGLLFYTAGLVMEKSKRNWFIGIRTPWTLSSDRVWEKTHKLGGELFKISGIVSLTGIVLPNLGMFLFLISVLSSALISVIYSYIEFKSLSR